MCIVREYRHQDFDGTLSLMNLCPNSLEIESEREQWDHISKVRAINPKFHTLIAEKDEKIVGMCFADIKRDEDGRFSGLIRHIIVDPNFRRQGIASKLIIKAVNYFLNLKIYNIRVQVSNKIRQVIPLFEKFNFECSAIVMEKDVPKIREYKESDYAAAKELIKIYSDLIHIPFNESEWIQTLKIRMYSPQYRTLISELEGTVTGMALINIYMDEMGHTIGSIENVIVHPNFRARGFGKDLIMRAIETLNVLNVDKIRIMAHLDLKNNLKIFEDVGFHIVASIMDLKIV